MFILGKRRARAAIALAALAFPAVLITAVRAGEGRPQLPPPSVRVEMVGAVSQSEPEPIVGTVVADETVHLTARVPGTLWKAAFREGAPVKQGDLLYEIEDTVYKANREIARAAVKQIEAELEWAQKDHARSVNLLKTQAVPEQIFDQSLRALRIAEAKLDEAKANLALSENDLSYTRVHAPAAGRIGENRVSEGNYVTPTIGTLATIVKYDPAKVVFSLSEERFFRYFKNVDSAAGVEFSIVRANGQPYTGEAKVDFIDNQVDLATRTLMIHLVCPNADSQLIPGGYVRVLIAEKFAAPRPAVNLSAVMTDGRTHYVYMVDGENKVVRRDIVPGPLVGNMQAVESGLSPGERVIVGGLNKVRPGMTVNPADPVPPASGGVPR